MAPRERPAVAVDFGTSTSLVAERWGRQPAAVLMLNGLTSWMASIAAFDGRRFVVGERAQEMPEQVIRSVKRAITDKQTTVQIPELPNAPEIPADNVIVAILAELKKRANAQGRALGRLKEVRLGCPAMWDGSQRRRLLELAGRSGIPANDATLIDEPVAAGISWLAEQYLKSATPVEGRLVVFDMGGGTLDVAVMDVVGGEHPDVRVLASLGATIAGDQLDAAVCREFETTLAELGTPIDSLANPARAAGLLRVAASSTKVSLTDIEAHTVVLPPHAFGRVPPLRYTREQLEEVFEPLMQSAEQLVLAALKAARLNERFRGSTYDSRPPDLTSDIKYVLLAGGMSRIPMVGRRLAAMFPSAELVTSTAVEPDEAIVSGLTDTVGYERINLHRPAFDFVLEWDGGAQRRVLYEAYTPLYEPWHLATGRSRLGYERLGKELDLPQSGEAYLRVTAANGQHVDFVIDGHSAGRVPLKLGRDRFHFKIYCDGHISLTDGDGHHFVARVDSWPVIRGRDDAKLKMESERTPPPDPPTAWYLDKEYVPPPPRRSRRDA